MRYLTQWKDFDTVLEHTGGPCVSLFAPTHRGGPDTRQNPIRFKNLVSTAETQLHQRGVDEQQAEQILAPAKKLIDDHDFWQHQDRGLAVFLKPDDMVTWQVPFTLQEQASVADRFYVRPLLAGVDVQVRFYLLLLTLNQMKCYESTDTQLHAIDLPDAPTNLAEALMEDAEKTLQYHGQDYSGASTSKARREAIYHGQGTGGDDQVAKRKAEEYVRQVAAAVDKHLGNERAPLVVAAVDWVFHMYEDASEYPHLVDKPMHGNWEHLSTTQLFEQARDFVQAELSGGREEALQTLEAALGSDRAVVDVNEVVTQAARGRVELLVVNPAAHVWGTFDGETQQVQMHEQRQPNDDDLLEIAVCETLRQSGEAHIADRHQFPATVPTPAAAVLRY